MKGGMPGMPPGGPPGKPPGGNGEPAPPRPGGGGKPWTGVMGGGMGATPLMSALWAASWACNSTSEIGLLLNLGRLAAGGLTSVGAMPVSSTLRRWYSLTTSAGTPSIPKISTS